jgi:hypothetical protein
MFDIYRATGRLAADEEIPPDRFISRLSGDAVYLEGSQVNAASANHEVDVLAAYNAVNNRDLSGSVGWVPTLFIEIEPAFKVPSAVESRSGPFNW